MRAAVYVRVSSEEQARKGYSLAEQTEACRNYCREHGAKSIVEFRDEGVSGAVLERPGLEALRKEARAGRIDLVVVRDPDRFSRKLAHQLLLTEELEKLAVKLVFLDFEWKDTPEGRLFYALRGAIAEYEKEKIRERMIRGKVQKAKQGGIPGIFSAYGYKYSPESGKVQVLEEEARIVRWMFSWFSSEDLGINGIARRLNEMGIPTRKHRPAWHRQVVRQILTNPVYTGTWYYRRGQGKRPRDDWIPIPVPPVIEPELWSAVQNKIEKARRLWAGGQRQQYLLSGIVTCGDCQAPVNGCYSRSWGRSHRTYTCYHSTEGSRNQGCRPVKVLPAEVLEKTVWQNISRWFSQTDKLSKYAAEAFNLDQERKKEIVQVQGYLKELERGQETILEALSSGLLGLDDKTVAKLLDLKKREKKLQALQRKLSAVSLDKGSGSFSVFHQLAFQLINRLDELDFIDKRALVRTVVEQVIVTGKGAEVEVKILAKIPDCDLCQ